MLNKQEYMRKWRKNNREGINIYQREWYLKNKEKMRKWWMDYNQKHPRKLSQEERIALNKRRKEKRHVSGENKKYQDGMWEFRLPKLRKIYSLRRRKLAMNAGELKLETVQIVYEDNIKKHGTLTCYLCLKPIPFGIDNLEHKIPLSRGGNNNYNNLGVACQSCNFKKHNKTVEEFLCLK